MNGKPFSITMSSSSVQDRIKKTLYNVYNKMYKLVIKAKRNREIEELNDLLDETHLVLHNAYITRKKDPQNFICGSF